MAARHRQLPTRPGGCLSGACSCSTTYGAVQDSARKSVRTELLLDRRHADTEPSLRSLADPAFGVAQNALKRVVVTPPPGHPSSEVQLNSTCT